MIRFNKSKKIISILFCLVLIAVTALTMTSCGTKDAQSSSSGITSEQNDVSFSVTVVDATGSETTKEFKTSEKTVGTALLKDGFISGNDGDYGLYVKTVNGITLDYDKDGMYWAFYINGEYATTGVDKTDVTPGVVYSFKAEK